MRAAEEPLRSDFDVAGLRARVLERLEELEERENLLSEFVPTMEAREARHEALKAMMGGYTA